MPLCPQELPPDVARVLPEVRVLHVDDNWLTSLGPDLAGLSRLTDLRLAGNPFRCDCRSLWMKDWLLGHRVRGQGGGGTAARCG